MTLTLSKKKTIMYGGLEMVDINGRPLCAIQDSGFRILVDPIL